MSKKETRIVKAGRHLGTSIIEMIHLMYQNVTARRFLEALINTLQVELNRRRMIDRRQ